MFEISWGEMVEGRKLMNMVLEAEGRGGRFGGFFRFTIVHWLPWFLSLKSFSPSLTLDAIFS